MCSAIEWIGNKLAKALERELKQLEILTGQVREPKRLALIKELKQETLDLIAWKEAYSKVHSLVFTRELKALAKELRRIKGKKRGRPGKLERF